MRYLRRFSWCFLIAFIVVLAYTLFAAWDEAGDSGSLEGILFDKAAGFLNYWLFWGVLYTGTFYIIAWFVLALLFTSMTAIYDLARFLWKSANGLWRR